MSDNTTKRILIVDDNEDHLYLTKARLEMVNSEFSCTTVHSGEECLAALLEEEYDLIISDYDMRPGMSGLDLLSYLKKKSIEIPVIVISEIGDKRIEQRARSGGAADYIDKSIGYEDFPSIVDSIRKAISGVSEEIVTPAVATEKANASVFANNHEIGILLDADGQKIEEASMAASKAFAGNRDLSGTVLAGLVRSGDRTELRRIILRALQGERSTGKIGFVRHDGSVEDFDIECIARRSGRKIIGARITARRVN